MKIIIGIALILTGIFLGLYLGIWWAFIGGIVTIIKQIQAPHVNASAVAFGVARIVFATLIGWVSALVLIVTGFAMLGSGLNKL